MGRQSRQLANSQPTTRISPAGCGGGRHGMWSVLVESARALVEHARQPQLRPSSCELANVRSLDDHLLTDIGLEVDAVRLELPAHSWPN